MKDINKKKRIFFLCPAVAALAVELIICNFSAWRSLFIKEKVVFEEISVEGGVEAAENSAKYLVTDGVLTLHLSNIDEEIHTLFMDVEFPECATVPYTVSLTDEGNCYPYPFPERILTPTVKKSRYTNLYPSGRVGSMDIQFTLPAGSSAIINGISANVHIPFIFSPGRFFIILTFLYLLYQAVFIQNLSNEAVCIKNRKQFIITALTVIILTGMSWKLATINPMCVSSPWPHHKQYKELAESITKGRVYLDYQPSEALLNAENPYDTIYLQANGIEYLADYAYYDGKYYVYFGIVPELLMYLPCYILTGHHLPNYIAVFLFYGGFILSIFALFHEICTKWFPRTPFIMYLIAGCLTVCCGNYLFIIARPDLYNVPVMSANMFTAAGLWLWIKGKHADSGRVKNICFLFGSLCMALVAGCRPQMLLFSFLAIPLFWNEVIKERKLFSKNSLPDTVCICLPYIIIAMGIMYYNGIRFGSVFDFGATYSLTSNDMNKRTFNLHQTLLGLWHYFLRPPVIESEFPFVQGVRITSSSYMGRLTAEYTYGGLLTSNAFLWALLSISGKKTLLKSKGLYAFTLLNIAISLILCIVDVTGAGILQRYATDMIFGIWLAAALLWFAWAEQAVHNKNPKTVMLCLTAVCLLQAVYGLGVVFGNGDLGVNIQTSNPTLYYYIKELLTF